MDEVARFIETHRTLLLRYLDGKAPADSREPAARDYVRGVLDEWITRFASRRLPEPGRAERTFWFALYQLEELGGVDARKLVDPFERLMLDDLECVRELLRTGSDLPARFFATRPGELPGEGDLPAMP